MKYCGWRTGLIKELLCVNFNIGFSRNFLYIFCFLFFFQTIGTRVQNILPSAKFPILEMFPVFTAFPAFFWKKKEENLEKRCSMKTALSSAVAMLYRNWRDHEDGRWIIPGGHEEE